jgi:hypothetical protein
MQAYYVLTTLAEEVNIISSFEVACLTLRSPGFNHFPAKMESWKTAIRHDSICAADMHCRGVQQ